MFSIAVPRPVVALALVAGLLAVAGPAAASSAVVTDKKDPDKLTLAPRQPTKVDAFVLPEVDDEVLMADMGGQYGIIAVLIGL